MSGRGRGGRGGRGRGRYRYDPRQRRGGSRLRSQYEHHDEGENEKKDAPEMRILREFHNLVKRKLLDTYAVPRGTLLDLASGKGGDFKKFMHLDLTRVWCSDINSVHLDEARSRLTQDAALQKWQGQRKISLTHMDLNVADDSHPFWISLPDESVHAVSCFFAIHYFAKSLASLTALLDRAGRRLRPGGYFIGCCPDGDAIQKLVSSTGGVAQQQYATEYMKIQYIPRNDDEEKDGGNQALVMTLQDSIIQAGQLASSIGHYAMLNQTACR